MSEDGARDEPRDGGTDSQAVTTTEQPIGAAAQAVAEGRVDPVVAARGLRRHAARGTLITAAFQIGLAVLLLLRRVIVAAFLTKEEFGIWGLLLATLLLVLFIKHV